MCDSADLPNEGCYNIGNNAQTEDLYEFHNSILKLQRLEVVLLVVIIIDMFAKLYNDNLVK